MANRAHFPLRLLVVLIVLVAVFPILIFAFIKAEGNRVTTVREYETDARILADQTAASLGRMISGIEQMLGTLSRIEAIRGENWDEIGTQLRIHKQSLPFLVNLFVTDEQGQAIASAIPQSHPVVLTDRTWFKRIQANHRLALGEYQIGRISGKPGISIAVPIRSDVTHGKLKTVTAALDLDYFQEYLESLPVIKGFELLVFDRHGTILARIPRGNDVIGKQFPAFGEIQASSSINTTDADGMSRCYQLSLVKDADYGLWVGVGIPSAQITGESRDAYLQGFLVISLAGLSSLVLAVFLADRYLVRPIREITAAATSFKEGNLSTRTQDGGAREISRLAHTFNEMAEALFLRVESIRRDEELARKLSLSLQEQMGMQSAQLELTSKRLHEEMGIHRHTLAKLRRNESTAKAFLNALPDAGILIDTEGNILLANSHMAERFGCPAEDVTNHNFFELGSPILRDSRRRHLSRAIASKQPVVFEDERDGRRLMNHFTPILDQKGEIVAIAVLSLDITSRWEIEEKLRQSINRLERALADIKTLSGLVPICSGCKKIRDDKGYWNQIESYLRDHTHAEFSHGMCPECLKRLYPSFAEELRLDLPENDSEKKV